MAAPKASDSPADPVVCTMQFSSTDERPATRNSAMESTATGMEAETVSPTLTER